MYHTISETLPEIKASLDELHRVAEAKFGAITSSISARLRTNSRLILWVHGVIFTIFFLL